MSFFRIFLSCQISVAELVITFMCYKFNFTFFSAATSRKIMQSAEAAMYLGTQQLEIWRLFTTFNFKIDSFKNCNK